MEILTPKEAASLLKISEYTLLDYARKGKIPARKIANQWRFSKEELVDWFHLPTLDALLKEAEEEYGEGKTVRFWSKEQERMWVVCGLYVVGPLLRHLALMLLKRRRNYNNWMAKEVCK